MKKWYYPLGILAICVGLVLGCMKEGFWDSIIPETDEESTQSQITGYVFKPAIVPASDERVQQLNVPDGFSVQKFGENLGNPRILVTTSGGHLYASDREAGVVMLLEDTDGDGVADRIETVADIPQAHGLAVWDNTLYIVSIREIYAAGINLDGSLGDPVLLTDALPDGGQHPNRTLRFGPDGMMY